MSCYKEKSLLENQLISVNEIIHNLESELDSAKSRRNIIIQRLEEAMIDIMREAREDQ